jgi:hypothetical protein
LAERCRRRISAVQEQHLQAISSEFLAALQRIVASIQKQN